MTYLIWDLLCASLLWSVFCRSVRTDTTTRLDVRLALWFMGTASLVGMAAPLYGWTPDRITMLIVASIALLQVVMARHWRHGVPRHFIHPRHLVKRRAGDPQ